MQSFRYNKATLFLTLFLAVVAFGVGTSAYTEPIASWPTNTLEPIDTGMLDQAKIGGLAVQPFFARGNADFKQDLAIEGVAQGGNPGDTTSAVQITTNVLATGDIYAGDPGARNPAGRLQANSLRHNDVSGEKRVCGDANGIVVFCPPVATVIACSNLPDAGATVPAGYVKNADGTCTAVLSGTARLTCESDIPSVVLDVYSNPRVEASKWYSRTARLTLTFDRPTLPGTKVLFGGIADGFITNPAEGPHIPLATVIGRDIMPAPYTTYPGGQEDLTAPKQSPDPIELTIPTGVTSYTVYPLRFVQYFEGLPNSYVNFMCAYKFGWHVVWNQGQPLDSLNPKHMFFKLAPGTEYGLVNFSSVTAGATAHNINP